MNILVVGNGFDLAHGLPTTYKDFLRFIEVFREFIFPEGKFFSEYIKKQDIYIENGLMRLSLMKK